MKECRCPVCSSTDLAEVVRIARVPIHCNTYWQSGEEARNAPKGDIDLVFCRNCSHLFNIAFDPTRMGYTQEYENSLHYSARFQQYAQTLARRLVAAYHLVDKDIIEIGCGKGDFLRTLCELGNNRGLGFDPSYQDGRFETDPEGQFKIVRDFYSERYADYAADIICCRHVLEHIQFPAPFLETIRRSIGDRMNTIVFFEVPNALFTLKQLGIWDLIYEHYSYFTMNSLARLFTACGFNIKRLTDAFDGQFLCMDAFAARGVAATATSYENTPVQLEAHVSSFAQRYYSKVAGFRAQLDHIKKQGGNAVVWGAGSKGVTFLNTLQATSEIPYAVDINPHKQGKYLAGTAQKIVGPHYLKTCRPDTVFVMNPVYTEEIRDTLAGMGITCDLIPV